MTTTTENPDVNTTAAPASGEAEAQTDSVQVTAAPKAAPLDLTKGLQDAVKAGLEAAGATQQPKPEAQTASEAEQTEETQTEDITEASNETETDTTSTEAEAAEGEEEKGPVPYNRFQEVVQARQAVEAKVSELEPWAKAQQDMTEYCQRHNVSQDTFVQFLELAALYSSGDIEGFKSKLEPFQGKVKSFTGEQLSPQLQKDVESGEISLEYARRLQAAENQKTFAQEQAQKQAKAVEADRQRAQFDQVVQTFANWITEKRKAVPGFKEKTNGSPDGVYEYFLDKFDAEARRKGIKDSQSLRVLAEQVYKDVSRLFVSPAAKPNGKVLRTNSSHGLTPKEQPKSVAEAVRLGAAKAGLRLS